MQSVLTPADHCSLLQMCLGLKTAHGVLQEVVQNHHDSRIIVDKAWQIMCDDQSSLQPDGDTDITCSSSAPHSASMFSTGVLAWM